MRHCVMSILPIIFLATFINTQIYVSMISKSGICTKGQKISKTIYLKFVKKKDLVLSHLEGEQKKMCTNVFNSVGNILGQSASTY